MLEALVALVERLAVMEVAAVLLAQMEQDKSVARGMLLRLLLAAEVAVQMDRQVPQGKLAKL
jgi:hypothetical protein